MKLVAGFPDQRDQLLLNEMVNVLRLVILEKCGRHRRLFADLLQPLQNADQLIGRQNTRGFQSARVRAAAHYFALQQPPVEGERPLPTLEIRIQRLPEPPGPHLHRATSTRARALDLEGSPRIRMNPAASFWS